MTVSNNGQDENGRYKNGKAGDQTGREWYLRPWYDFGQNVVLWHPDQKVNDMIADMAEAAAENDHVGYDQYQRTTFYAALKKAGWKPEEIATDCESDCSAGVAAIVIGAGHRLGLEKLQKVSKDCYTGNLRAALVKAGFEAHEESKYTDAEANLPRGAINLNESHHVNIQTTGGNVGSKPATSKSIEKMARDVISGKYGTGETRRSALGSLFDKVQERVNEILGVSKSSKVETSATTGTYVTVVNRLNVRTGVGAKFRRKRRSELTADGKKHSYPDGSLMEGTAVTVSKVKTRGNEIWGRIPSGWICLYNGSKWYARKN